MITELIITALTALVNAVGAMFPQIDKPAWLVSLTGWMYDVTATMAPLGAWFPFGHAATAAGFVLLAVGVAITVKLIRIAASFATLGGGSAA